MDEAVSATQEAEFQEAEASCRAALAANPEDRPALHNLAAVLTNSKRSAEALPFARRLRELDPNSRESLDLLSAILVNLPSTDWVEDYVEAVNGYQALLARNGADEPARASLTSLVAKQFARFQDSYRPTMISTVGRAGTYFTVHFFGFLERRLGSYSKDYDPLAKFISLSAFPNLHILKATVHGICPGFSESYEGPHRAAWEKLVEQTGPERVPNAIKDQYDPRLNERVRLVHLFRNPFDQIMSGYFKELRWGTRSDSPDSLSGYADSVVDYFITQHLSFREMAQIHPQQIMMLRFEELIAAPEQVFRNVLEFFGVPPVSPDLVRSAVKSSSVEALSKAEDRAGRPSGPGGQASHFDRDRNAPGRLKLTDGDRARIEARFGEFDIPMTDFAPSKAL